MRYVLGVIGMIILGIIAVMLFARTTTNQGGNVQTGKKTINVADYANDKSATLYSKYGQVTANEDRRTLNIYVSQSERKIEILDGYEGTVQKTQNYSNNAAAYDSFLKALDFAGFTRERRVEVASEDSCPTGSKYVYSLTSEGQEVSRLWNNTCTPLGGTLGNNGTLIRSLFQKQIPDYNKFVQGVTF